MSSSSLYSTDGARNRAAPTGGSGAVKPTTDDAAAKGPRRARRSRFGGVCAGIALLAAVVAAGVGYWLYPALVKAWRNTRSPDHPSEAKFATGVPQECVSLQPTGASNALSHEAQCG